MKRGALLWMGSLAERAVHPVRSRLFWNPMNKLAKRVLEEEDAIN